MPSISPVSYTHLDVYKRQAFVSAPLLTSLEGGVPVLVDGQVIGAVGVSGVKAEQDAQVARAGIAAL